ncbi:MAG: GHMP family kinase ATP-binding protein [Pseudobdellovibrio sp.]
MEKIFFKSPTRVDLAGGTLDLWPLYNFVNGASTINVAIDIWTSCEIQPLKSSEIKIQSIDLNKTWNFKNIEELFSSQDDSVLFYQCVFRPFKAELAKRKTGFEITTGSESPIGGGLGGSSSLVISILKSLHVLLKMDLPEPTKLVFLAHNIEAEMLRTPTGTQDYFPAVTGGVNVIDYSSHKMSLKVSSVSQTPIAEHFLLIYTGRSHHSGLNNFEVLKSSVQGDPKVLKALNKIKLIADDLKKAIADNNWEVLPELFRQEFDARIQLTPAFTSPEIERLNKICLEAGADAVKICGAGGGGCVLVWVAPENREKVIQVCEAENFKCLKAKPVNPLN